MLCTTKAISPASEAPIEPVHFCDCPKHRAQRERLGLRWSGKISKQGSEAVIAWLGIKLPVKFKVANVIENDDGTLGRSEAWGDDTGLKMHVVTIKRDLSDEMANQTLLHELRHCWQGEHLEDRGVNLDFVHIITEAMDYKSSPVEVDARQFSHDHRDNFKVTHADER